MLEPPFDVHLDRLSVRARYDNSEKSQRKVQLFTPEVVKRNRELYRECCDEFPEMFTEIRFITPEKPLMGEVFPEIYSRNFLS